MTDFRLSQLNAPAINTHARTLLERGDPLARQVVQQLLSRFPSYVEGWVTSSVISYRFGDAVGALRDVERALAVYPHDPSALLQKAQCTLALGRGNYARILVDEAIQFGSGKPALLHEAAFLYTQLGNFNGARQMYSEAIKLRSKDPALYADRAGVARILGDLHAAEADLDLAIQLAPQTSEWYLNRSQLRCQTVVRNHVKPILSLLQKKDLGWRERVQLHYALGKELEDLEDIDGAFGNFIAGAALRRQHVNYNVADDVATLARIETVFTTEQLSAQSNVTNGPTPIFVVGMPRSGTTLLERILGSIPAVHPAGELDTFARALLVTTRREKEQVPLDKLSLVDRSIQVDASVIGEEYLRRSVAFSAERPYFVDKTPSNFLYCGLIARALPNAKIVHVSRHPLANCLGMFKTLFAQGYPFSYAFGDLARYFAAYRRLMQHWRRVMPGKIVEVSYESLVHNFEEETRALAAACGLTWSDRCLSFHELNSPATSHSAAQVRQPLNLGGVTQWRRYGLHLKPLANQLVAAGVSPHELS